MEVKITNDEQRGHLPTPVNDQGQRRDRENSARPARTGSGLSRAIGARTGDSVRHPGGKHPTSRDRGGMAWDVPRPDAAIRVRINRTPSYLQTCLSRWPGKVDRCLRK